MSKWHTLSTEAWLHTGVHLLAVIAIFWFALAPPLWISLLALTIQYAQMKLLGSCILTNFAHKRGIMIGMTYWHFISYLAGYRKPKQKGRNIDMAIKLTIAAIVVTRIVFTLM